ncbi:MAG TPA: hypothetical protein VFO73_09225 [Candidatus Limnocylindrales bacterium]|nr:hypothetical protein [Candidatus Limnocylindrales bacterium]
MRRSAITRLVLVATVASIAAGLIGTTVAVARDPVSAGGRQVRLDAGGGRHVAKQPETRTVTVRDLPTPEGRGAAALPPLLHPEARPGQQAPSGPDALAAPAPITTTDAPPATQAVMFDGVARSDLEPPDPWVAVGPDHVVQAVNTTIRITDRSGVQKQVFDTIDFFDLVGFSEISPFDPRVIYDSLHGRWIAIATHWDCVPDPDFGIDVGAGYIDIAISRTADPTGTWELLYLGWADALPDYPGIGTSTDKVVLSANLFNIVETGTGIGCAGSGFAETELDAMAWTELLGTGDINVDFFYGGNDYPNDYFTWRPALQTPATSATVFVIGENFNTGAVTYTRLTGNPATFSTVMADEISLTGTVDPFAVPPAPQQPGSPATIVDAVDERPTDAVWQANQLAFVSTFPCNPAGGVSENRDCVRVAELSTAIPATPTALQDFLISEEGADHYMGGVGYAGNGDLHVVWTRSSEDAGEYPSSYAAHQLVTDAANQISEPQLLKAGVGTYDGTRWGDYVGVAQDPQVPNAVWQGNQYSDGTAWATHISQLQTGGSSFVPIVPLRVVDSRTNLGVTGIFAASVPKTFDVAGEGTIPADAIAVTGNVTVTGQNAAGFVAITPTATATPPSSTLNFPLGDTRANNFTTSLDASGRLAAVYKAAAGKSAHVIVDITGYFLAGDGEATYTTTDPTRVMDTRPVSHIGTATIFQTGVPQTLSIAGETGTNVPANATAITGNLTVVNQSKAGYLSVTPDPPVGVPASSTLNFPLGDVRANGLTADLNGAGDLSITYTAAAGATTHVLLDITGYYVEDTSGLLFYPLNPGRVLDSRSGAKLTGLTGAFSANLARTLDVDGHWGVPVSAEAITGNLTAVNQTAAGFIAVTPVATNNPTTSSINFPLGDIRANGITVPLDSGSTGIVYKAVAGRTTHVLLDVTGYFK